MTQTWNINGREMTHAEVVAYRRRQRAGLPPDGPVEPDGNKAIASAGENQSGMVDPEKPVKTSKKSSQKKAKPVEQDESPEKPVDPPNDQNPSEGEQDELAEFAKLHAERAWINPKKKDRYYELREKFKK